MATVLLQNEVLFPDSYVIADSFAATVSVLAVDRERLAGRGKGPAVQLGPQLEVLMMKTFTMNRSKLLGMRILAIIAVAALSSCENKTAKTANSNAEDPALSINRAESSFANNSREEEGSGEMGDDRSGMGHDMMDRNRSEHGDRHHMGRSPENAPR